MPLFESDDFISTYFLSWRYMNHRPAIFQTSQKLSSDSYNSWFTQSNALQDCMTFHQHVFYC